MNFLELFAKPDLTIAHRGDRSIKPENTLLALRSSIGKCDFIEIDVQFSRDGVPIVLHDDTLGRTSNVKEIGSFAERYPWAVRDFTLNELERLDFGSWFYKEDPFGCIDARNDYLSKSEDRHEPLLTLERVLLFVKEKNIFINIEIKDMHNWMPDRDVVITIANLIKRLQAEPLVLLSSFYHNYLPICKELLPDIPTAVLTEEEAPENLIAYLKALQADAYHPDEQYLNEETVKKLRKAGYFVNAYTVNDPLRQQELFLWGVNGVFTDYLE
ncbi:MAG: glycerophosphodiester phosphodiesterase family protein [Campylobacterota bacterium]|nr:glycerophosphodiester phosphodiesterase family protein [Campylobacterota bacterium]